MIEKRLLASEEIYYIYDRKDLERVIILKSKVIIKDLVQGSKGKEGKTKTEYVFDTFIISRYEDLEDHIKVDLTVFDVTASRGTAEHKRQTKAFVKKFSLTMAECTFFLTRALNVVKDPSRIYGVLERFCGYEHQTDEGGLICVYGASGSGKSTFINDVLVAATNKEVNVIGIIASEPVARSLPLHDGLVKLICELVSTPGRACIAFDSFRGVVYGSGGSTLSGGVSAAMLEITMNLSRLASACNKIVLGVINPLNADEEKNATLIEALLGSTTGLMIFKKEDRDVVNLSHRFMEDRAFKKISKVSLRDVLATAKLPEVSTHLTRDLNLTKTVSHISVDVSNYRVNEDINAQLNVVSSDDTVLPTVKF